MPVILEDRPIETVREEVIDVLVHNYSHGFISSEAFERRLDVVIETTSHADIVKQIEDLDATPDDRVKAEKEKQFAVQYHDELEDDSETLISIFGGSDRSGQWIVPKTIYSISIFGGSNIDFTDAQFSNPNVKLISISIFGGDNIYVPENINVVSKAFCIFGGIDNKAPSMGGRQAPKITIEGLMLFGGTNIKLKTTLKEKFVAFANHMKTTFAGKSPK